MRYSMRKSCSSVLTNSKLEHFHSVLVVLRFTFGCWMSGGKKSQKKKDKEYRQWKWLLWMLQYGQFYQKLFLPSSFFHFLWTFGGVSATKDGIIWNYMLEFWQLVIPPERCWSSSAIWWSCPCSYFVPFYLSCFWKTRDPAYCLFFFLVDLLTCNYNVFLTTVWMRWTEESSTPPYKLSLSGLFTRQTCETNLKDSGKYI